MADCFTLEIACFGLQAALQAAAGGAHRIELCANPLEGGTTPSFGVLKQVRQLVPLPVFPIIRPHGGGFVYTSEELSAMADDVRLCRDLGFEGVVLGILHADGTVHFEATAKLVELAWPMEVTFHRAFDRVVDPMVALDTIIQAGCQRILTSGMVPNANDGAPLIAKLIQAAQNRIIIMPGSGLQSKSIVSLAKATGATEFHASARILKPSDGYNPPDMKEQLYDTLLNINELKSLLKALQHHFDPTQDEP